MIRFVARTYPPCWVLKARIQKHRGKPLLFHDKCPGFFYMHYTTHGTYSFASHPKDEAITVNCLAQGHKLVNEMGLEGNVLKWIGSYLSGRTTSVCIDGVFSQCLDLEYGIPQGSIVGPQQFNIYTIPIGNILRKHNLLFLIYADDLHVRVHYFGSCQPFCTVTELMSECIDEIKSWMTVNRLKFNEEKTEFLVAISDHLKHLLPPVTLRIGSKIIHPSESVRNLGIVFDTLLGSENLQTIREYKSLKKPEFSQMQQRNQTRSL